VAQQDAGGAPRARAKHDPRVTHAELAGRRSDHDLERHGRRARRDVEQQDVGAQRRIEGGKALGAAPLHDPQQRSDGLAVTLRVRQAAQSHPIRHVGIRAGEQPTVDDREPVPGERVR